MKTNWFAELLHYARLVGRDAAPHCSKEEVIMFWLRLYGALAEFPDELKTQALVFDPMGEDERSALQGNLRNVERCYRGCKEGLAALQAALSQDLCIYAELRRNTEGHLNQKAFLLQVNGRIEATQSLKTESTMKCLGGMKVPVTELQAAIQRVAEAHSYDDRSIARTIALAVEGSVQQILEARRILQ